MIKKGRPFVFAKQSRIGFTVMIISERYVWILICRLSGRAETGTRGPVRNQGRTTCTVGMVPRLSGTGVPESWERTAYAGQQTTKRAATNKFVHI